MASGGLFWLFDEMPSTPTASSSSTTRQDDSLAYAGFPLMVNVAQGPNRHSRLTRSAGFADAGAVTSGPSSGETSTAESTQSAYFPQTPVSPDDYRELAVSQVRRAAERLFGEEFARLNADLLASLPAVDQLAAALAAGQLTSIRAGRLAPPSLPTATTGAVATGGGGEVRAASTPGLGVGTPGGSGSALASASRTYLDSEDAAAEFAISYAAPLTGGVQTLGDGPNTPPVALDDYYSLLHDTILDEYAPGVMWNDYDYDGDPLSAGLVSGPTHAQSFSFGSDGSFTYEPNPLWAGEDGFVYEVSDGEATDQATVYLYVTNEAPWATDDYYSTLHDTTIVESAPGVMQNDWDYDGDPITASLVSGPTHADSFAFNYDGSFTYTPAFHYVGSDSFAYRVNDQLVDSNIATVTIYVQNNAPWATNDYYSTLHDTTIVESAPGVMSNDSDIDNDTITASLVTSPSHADYFVFTSDGAFTYTPAPHYVGDDSFTYLVDDEIADSNTATVSLLVTNSPPVAQDDGPYSLRTDSSLIVFATGVLENDYDYDNDEITAVLHTPPANGTLHYLHDDGSFWYEPNPGFAGIDTFTYYANDGVTNSAAPATVTMHVVKLDLDVRTIYRNLPAGTLEDVYEESPGAWVPYNDDDDDYDAANTPDYQQTGAIAGENDLLPIVLRQVEPLSAGGTYHLNFGGGIRIWRNADRTDEVWSGTDDFDATVETTLYVEGTTAGAAVPIVMDWDGGSGWDSVPSADTVVVNVFRWEGPLNVPGYSIYKYRATGGMAGAGNSMWIAPLDGTLHSSSQGDSVDEADILWDGGPVVGMALYQAQANYIWGLDVNVVEISMGTSNVSFNNFPSQEPGTALIHSWEGAGQAMQVSLTVPNIEGAPRPHAGGATRGVKFMQMGLVQDGQFTRKAGVYPAFAPERRRVSSVEGQGALDPVSGSTLPWYDSTGWTADPGIPGFYAPPSDATVTNVQFDADDSPNLLGTDTPVLTGSGVVDAPVERLEIELDLNVYFAVRTVQNVNGSADIYTQRLSFGWQFDGSGTVAGAGAGNYGVWTRTGTGNALTRAVSEVTDGSRLPDTTPPTLTDILAPETWTTDPPF